MSRRKHQPKPEVEREADYYQLKTDAVKALVEANEENSPEVSREELRQYRSGPKLKLADWVKLLLIKFWFAGAVCFFFLWGLGGYMADILDTLFVTGVALGMVTDLLTNNVLRYFETTKGAANRWMMVTRRGFASFPLNILHAFAVLTLVFFFYDGLNRLIVLFTGQTGTVYLGVEPFTFGLFCLGFDLLLIQCKHWIFKLLGKTES